jgi:predicted transposase/invertase (TIGR01784 family)
MEEQMMLATEWNLEDALAVRFQEGVEAGFQMGYQAGLQEGMQEGLQEGLQEARQEVDEEFARNALAQGIPLEVVSKISGMDIETIRRLSGNRRP